MSTDLKTFRKLFGHDKVREVSGALEYRVQNLDNSLKQAREVIRANNLNLIAHTTGSMAQIRAFEVKEVANA